MPDWMSYIAAMGISTPFAPSQLPGLTAWFDASNAGSVTISSANFVSSMSDLIGTANVVQTTTANWPAINLVTVNGKSSLSFDGSNDNLSGTYVATTDCMIFLAWQSNTTSQTLQASPFTTGNANTNNTIQIAYDGTLDIEYQFNDSLNTLRRIDLSHAATATQIFVIRHFSNNQDTWVDGTIGSSGTFTSVPEHKVFRFGVNRTLTTFASGNFCELLFYTANLSTGSMNQVGSYLAGKWGGSWTDI